MKITRNTVAKTQILELITGSDVALSHSELQIATKGTCDRVTIYRVLDRLVEEGMVHKILNVDGVVRYASCYSCKETHHHQHSHIHFSCQKCKAVTCLNTIKPLFKLPDDYTVLDTNFTIVGLCPHCSS